MEEKMLIKFYSFSNTHCEVTRDSADRGRHIIYVCAMCIYALHVYIVCESWPQHEHTCTQEGTPSLCDDDVWKIPFYESISTDSMINKFKMLSICNENQNNVSYME